MNSRQSSYESKGDSASLRVTPVTSYDPFEAKFCASLFWLVLMKTQQDSLDTIPPQVTSPIERDAEQRKTVRPEVVELLTNGEVYSHVCDSIFSNKQPLLGHWAVVQCLSRHGFYVVEEGDIPVTDSTLQQKRPFRKSTHLALMDGIMAAYTSKVVTIPNVVQAVRRFAPFNASKELPFDLEDALLLWLNKVCSTLNDKEINKQKLHAENLLRDQDKAKRFRFRRDQLQPKTQTLFPIIDDLLKGVSDGQCLLGIVLFYNAHSVKLEDIKFGPDLSQEDMVQNIELFRSLCSQYICTTSLSLQVEDFMYSSQAMKPNLLALLAEMFYKCELEDETLTEDKKVRSRSVTNMTGFSTLDNVSTNRSSSAPMLASEIIAALSPAVGRKLKDFAKEKSQKQSASNQLADNEDSNQEKQLNSDTSFDKTTRSYSLKLDFTDEDGITTDSKDKGNPFSGIYRKPVLLTRKHSAPEPSLSVVPKLEPSLNRRTKQKPRNLALEDWEMDDKDAIDVHVTDLQRSQSLTELASVEPRKSFHAWQEGTSSSDPNLDLNSMKNQRISLDFRLLKPQGRDIVTRPRDIVTRSSLHQTERNREVRVSQDSLSSSSPKSVDYLPSKLPFDVNQKDLPVSQSTMSEQELKEFEEMEAIVLAQRSNEANLNKSCEMNDGDVLNASVSSDDMNRFRLEVLQRLTADKIKSLEKQSYEDNKEEVKVNSGDKMDNRTETDHAWHNAADEGPEELLSPINESSEPLHSTGSLPETRSSTPSTTPSSPCSPLDVAPFMPEFFMTSPANTLDKKAYKKAAKRRQKYGSKDPPSNFEARASVTPRLEEVVQDDSRRHVSIEMLTRGSYTMDQISLDAAKAAGIPVIGSDSIELRNNPNEMRLSRTTVRSLSVPMDNDSILQHGSLQDRPSSSSHSHIPFMCDDPKPLNGHPLVNDIQNTRHLSSQQLQDVIIFHRKSPEAFYGATARAQVNDTGLPNPRDQSYQSRDQGYQSTRQSFVSRVNTNEGSDYNQQADNRHSFYPQQFVNRHIDEFDGSRSPRNQDPMREYFVSTSYIPTNTESARSYSNVPTSNQNIRSSNQEMKLRYNNTDNNVVMDPALHVYRSMEAGTSQESRVVYSDQYGTYVKNNYHGCNVNTSPMYNQERSSPRHINSPGQFATFRKDPCQTVLFRQPGPGNQFDYPASANQITTSRVHSTTSPGIPLTGNRTNWEYQPNTIDQQTRPTSHQYNAQPGQQSPNIYTSTGHQSPNIYTSTDHQSPNIYTSTGHQSPNIYASTNDQYGVSPRHSSTSTSPHDRYHEPPRQEYVGSYSLNDVNQNHKNEMMTRHVQPQQPQHSKLDGDDRIQTPERKSQAFTVDLDTGELKEFNSSSGSISPRSPSSAILRSKTFRKGPEERVFEYDPKSLPGQLSKDKVSPQISEGYPAVVLRKDENNHSPGSVVNRTSWSESAEALKAVLYNGFPNKDDEVVPSPRARTANPRSAEKTSPGARITWLTAGRNSFGGQVLLNEKGEIEEPKDDDVEQDTANPQHLAVLSLHFEEKRRQIEAERQRSQDQWEKERRKIGETTFWYTIGRAQGSDKDVGKTRPGFEKFVEPPASPGQPTPPIGRSTPFECSSPLQTKPVYHSPTAEGYQSPRSQAQAAIGHGFHQASVQRPGYQSPVISQTGFQFPSAYSPTYQPVSANSNPSNEHGHQAGQNIYSEEQEFETRQFLLSEYAVHGSNQQDKTPLPSSQNESNKSPVRKCWEVSPPLATAVFAGSPSEGVALHVDEDEQEDNQFEDPADILAKKGVALFIGDETEKPKDGLTPEQQRKRDRFLKSRQKKQEEERVRRDAEIEKKRLRELKQREIEEKKRLEEEQKRDEQQRRMKQTRERMAASNGGESTYRHVTNPQEDNSAFSEFSGPRCYVKPSGKSNRKLITNAISHVCLSGTVNKENKEKCLQAIADSPGFHFIVLFKDGLKFRGLYMLNPETEQAFKVFGIGPKVIISKMVDCVYKYSSGGKEFTKIPSKALSISVDGVAILKAYWQSNKPNVASKTQSNLKRPPRPPQR